MSLSEICPTESTPTRAAASSMANGMPSSRRHTPAIAVAFSGVSAKPDALLRPRSMNSRTDSYPSSSPTVGGRPGSGAESGGTERLTSAANSRGSRLVASNRNLGHESRRASTSRAAASMRCSQLSSTSSDRLSRKVPTSVSVMERPGCSATPERGGHLLRHQATLREPRQLHEPHPVRVGAHQVPGHLQGQPRLSAPAGPREGKQPRHREGALYLPDLPLRPTKLVLGAGRLLSLPVAGVLLWSESDAGDGLPAGTPRDAISSLGAAATPGSAASSRERIPRDAHTAPGLRLAFPPEHTGASGLCAPPRG